jgi:hypothetical protein
MRFAAMVPLRDHPEALTRAITFPLIRQTSEVLLGLAPGNALRAAQASAEAGLPARAVSASQRTAPAPKAESQTGQSGEATKTYGAGDRRALDRLIETTGAGQGSSK